MSEADPAIVSGFRLDKYEVTVGRFRQFVNAWNGGSGYVPPAGSGKHTYLNGGNGLSATGGGYEPGWATSDNSYIAPTDSNLACAPKNPTFASWTHEVGKNENLPINCINWYESYAFCIWDGGFVPSEAEWVYAAAGGDEERAYPWGATDPGTGNQYAIYGCFYPANNLGNCAVAPVGAATLGGSLWGQLDLAGNVFEGTLDWYAAYVTPCTDCAYLTTAADGHADRGGDFLDGALLIVPPSRTGGSPAADRSAGSGVRCARTP
jgi:formylglycine-generating enzyme required for sulfatase activity